MEQMTFQGHALRGAIRHLLESCAFEAPTQGTLL
jgi:hypothetical protein